MARRFTFKAAKQDIWDCFKEIYIKLDSEVVGSILSTQDGKWIVRLQVPASERALAANPNCPWMWAKIKRVFDSDKEAKSWLNENKEYLLKTIYTDRR